jgi:chromosome condensin MukBEF ATPase and DNA-binding subunit MukB
MSELEVKVAVLETEMKTVKDDVHDIKTDVKAIRDTLAQAKGGWKTLMLVAGVAGSAGALMAKFLPFMVK